MKRKPIIGIAGHLIIQTTSPVIGVEYDYNRNNYAKSILEAGGIPLYIPVIEDTDVIEEQVKICDGILIPGGEDINPLFYNEQPLPLLQPTIPRVDKFQIEVITQAYKRKKPILAICRGMQILNVAFGGTVYQDVSYGVTNPLQHYQLSQLYDVAHTININKGSVLYQLFGSSILVNSGHHQANNKIAQGFYITATAPDGIVEGIELEGEPYVVGVQWHPEMLLGKQSNMIPLFRSFIQAARC